MNFFRKQRQQVLDQLYDEYFCYENRLSISEDPAEKIILIRKMIKLQDKIDRERYFLNKMKRRKKICY